MNKNLSNRENYLKLSSYIIKNVYRQDQKDKKENHEIKRNKGRNSLLLMDDSIRKELNANTNQKDLIKNIKRDLKNPYIEFDIEKFKIYIQNKIDEYNKINSKKILCVLTEKTLYKLYILDKLLKANCPIIIQGFTSAGKSFLASVVSLINNMKPLSAVLSEHTSKEDLYGRDVINKEDNTITFVPGILIKAFTNGNILILNECDLANPEVLTSILNSLTKNEINEKSNIYYKMRGYNVILTMNGEAKGFENQERNTLTSNILSKFMIVSFDEMESRECEEIFDHLLSKHKAKTIFENYKNYKDNFINLHRKMEKEMKKPTKSIDSVVILRNLKYCCYFLKDSISPRIAAEISYTARFPLNERKDFDEYLNKFDSFQISDPIKLKIKNYFKDYNLVYDENFIRVVFLALKAIKQGLNILLIGKKWSGLTKLSEFIAKIYNKERNHDPEDYKLLLCTSETSVEDLIGCYQPLYVKKETNLPENLDMKDLSKYFEWKDGPILIGGKEGLPIILDNINYSKPQVIERLNSLLEENPKYDNIKFNVNEKESGDSIAIKNTFIIIGTMRIDDDNKFLSKALMNRFVSIYVDEININDENIFNEIISNTINKIDKNLEIVNKNIEDAEIANISIDYPDWYHIKNLNLTQENINELKNLLKKTKFNTLKELVNNISLLVSINERVRGFGLNLEDSYYLLNNDFDKIDSEKIGNLMDNILNEYEKDEMNKFFYTKEKDMENNDARNMIINLIKCDLSNRPLFLQGIPGSGKSCAARHYGAHRKFNNRIPISTVNCHNDLTFDYLVGNFSFQNNVFRFVEGPLIIAMKKGEPFLLDEFNLSPESIYINLLPLFKAEIGEKVYLKGVPFPVPINPGFLLIATGNANKEKGRSIIPKIILEEFNIFQVKNIDINRSIVKNILQEEYSQIKQEDNEFKPNFISTEQIIKVVKALSEKANFKLSLRQIKCLFDRISRFCVHENFYSNQIEGFKKIPVVYVVISYIIPQLNIGMNMIKLILKEFHEIFQYSLEELNEFISSKVEILGYHIENENDNNKKYIIKKGKLCLNTKLNKKELPQVILQTYFWIRMSCSLDSEEPSNENILLNGGTSYKEFILNL